MTHVVMLRTRLTAGAQPEPVVADTAASLAAQGYDVTLLAWDRDGGSDAESQAAWGRIVRYRRACPLNAPLAFALCLPRFWGWCLGQLLAMRGRELVVHAHDLDTLPLAAFAAKLLRAALVYDCHENYPALVEGAVSHRAVLRLHRLEARLLPRCDGVLAAGPDRSARGAAGDGLGDAGPDDGVPRHGAPGRARREGVGRVGGGSEDRRRVGPGSRADTTGPFEVRLSGTT